MLLRWSEVRSLPSQDLWQKRHIGGLQVHIMPGTGLITCFLSSHGHDHCLHRQETSGDQVTSCTILHNTEQPLVQQRSLHKSLTAGLGWLTEPAMRTPHEVPSRVTSHSQHTRLLQGSKSLPYCLPVVDAVQTRAAILGARGVSPLLLLLL